MVRGHAARWDCVTVRKRVASLADNTMANECLLPDGGPRELYQPLLD